MKAWLTNKCQFSRRYWELAPSPRDISAYFELLKGGAGFASSSPFYLAARLEEHIPNYCHYLSVTLATGTGGVKSPFHLSRRTNGWHVQWLSCGKL